MINELYIVGDQSRLVVKNLINQFKQTDCNINVFSPYDDEIDRLPPTSIHLLILLSDDIDFDRIKTIVVYQKKYDYHLCFIGKMTTLSWEDNRFFQQIPSIKLESYTVNTDKLLELMDRNDNTRKHILVDLVLLDYKMPTMDGPKVLEAIRNDERLKSLPVIFLTANNDRQSVINVMPLKPDGYILKSKSPDEIKSAVVDFFKNRVIKV